MILVCNIGFGVTSGTCTACSGDVYKSTVGDTECINVPENAAANNDNTAFGV